MKNRKREGSRTKFRVDTFCLQAIAALLFGFVCVVIFCVIFIGDRMGYYDYYIVFRVVSNPVLAGICVAAAACWIGMIRVGRSRELLKQTDRLLTLGLVFLFTGVYFINSKLCREIAFFSGWDAFAVEKTALNFAQGKGVMGELEYYSLYPTNLPITYIMAWLYCLAEGLKWYPYPSEFIWIQVNCVAISVTGFALCMSVKKLKRRWIDVLLAFLLYCAGICVSPWKIIPYTDMYAFPFPCLAICMYIYSKASKSRFQSTVSLILAYGFGMIGGMIKASVYLVPIAMFLIETIISLYHMRERMKVLLLEALVIVLCTVGISSFYDRIYRETDFQPIANLETSWHHYFLMGVNDFATGAFNSDVVGVVLEEFRDRPKEERNAAELERAFAQIKEKGLIGYPVFLLKKLTMTFNDGTFCWNKEGLFFRDYYYPISDADAFTVFLRDCFWPNYKYSGRVNTYSQLVWLFTLLGIPGFCFFGKKRKCPECSLIQLSLLGIFFYIMLFEARARYLLCFWPLYTLAAVLGYDRYEEALTDLRNRRKRIQNRKIQL